MRRVYFSLPVFRYYGSDCYSIMRGHIVPLHYSLSFREDKSRPFITDDERREKHSMKNKKWINDSKVLLLAVALGAFAGVVIWAFLRAVGLVTGLLWEKLPEVISFKAYPVFICTAGGLIIGIFRKIFGDYPEELTVVMGKIKKDGHYDYSNMFVMLIAAFLPLVFAASIGPEAGLTGVIVGLCYWVGDNLKYAKTHEKDYSEIGEAVTLGVLFHAPLFGIFAVEEENANEDVSGVKLPKIHKLLLYGASTLGGLATYYVLNTYLGTAMAGFPSLEDVTFGIKDCPAAILYVVVGILMAYIFNMLEHLLGKLAGKIPAIVCETICGLVLGAVITFFPIVAFSGEEQMGELAETFTTFAPLVLIGIALLKMLMTTFCIKFGMKGGHFFPLIYSCVCMGFAFGILFFGYDFGHLAFAAGMVTAACLGTQLKKPLAAALLCLLCFPLKMLFFMFVAAALGACVAKQAEARLKKKED